MKLHTFDLNGTWYSTHWHLIAPDKTKAMYRDGNKLGARHKQFVIDEFVATIASRANAASDGTAEYLPDNYLIDMLAKRKSDAASMIATKLSYLTKRQAKLALYGKQLTKRHAAMLATK